MEEKWWHDSVIYQIYPRSFQDSNGDGIGDIPGIINRLDYLQELGIDVIWLSPVYKSPNDDNGYDISDYRDIMDEFGTMDDMERLIAEAKKRGIKIVMDLVANHTSDEHPWFIESKKSKDSPYRDYYIWRDPVDEKEPNDLESIFSGSAWEYDDKTDQYYLHLFSKKQPDLNWENPSVRQEIWDLITYWLDKGIGGFRMDVIEMIGKQPDKGITINGPMLHEYLKEMNRESFGKYDVLTVGEAWGADLEHAKQYSNPNGEELSMIFQFEHLTLDEDHESKIWNLKPLDHKALADVMSKWQIEMEGKGWNSLFWNNHDTPRIVSRWGDDQDYRIKSAKMFAIMLHMMKGTPYIYQGEEIGMINCPVTSIEEVDDIQSRNMYFEKKAEGYSDEELIHAINLKGRDNARRPMAWNNKKNGGFTDGEPWLKLNPNYLSINVEQDRENSESIFKCYQELIRLRKNNPVIIYGSFQRIPVAEDAVFVYKREWKGVEVWVIVNMNKKLTEVNLNFLKDERNLVITNYQSPQIKNDIISLRPYEAVVLSNKRLIR